MSELKTKIEKNIASLKRSEKITKERLSVLSRDVLVYVTKTQDIAMANRLINVLTPVNKRTATIYFNHFLPWKMEEGEFKGKHKGDKLLENYKERLETWLSVPENDIWVWASENVKIEKAKIDYIKKITNDVTKALNNEDDPANPMDIIKAVMAGGITSQDIVNMGATIIQQMKEEEKLQAQQEEQLKDMEEA